METLFDIIEILTGLMIGDIWREINKKEKPQK